MASVTKQAAMKCLKSINAMPQKQRAKRTLKPTTGMPANRKAMEGLKPNIALPDLCTAIQQLQRQRVVNLKSRIMIENRLVASVATCTGYHAGMEDLERKKRFDDAAKLIKAIRSDQQREIERTFAPLVLSTSAAVDGFDTQVKAYEKEMERLAKRLHVAEWVNAPAQCGFGFLGLAIIVGECGDLNNYPNPGKLWRRMGCAPFESRGEMKMPSTWRGSKPSLSAAEWEECGYSPRRRSAAYVIGDSLLKNNKGPYRERYSEVKRGCQEKHPDWKWNDCSFCKGKGCDKCFGTGKTCAHANNHAMLLATKLLLKNLWIEWTDGGNDCY